MRGWTVLGAALLAAAGLTGSSAASIPAVYKVECPITGKMFDFNGLAAYSSFGAGLDGHPFGSTLFPISFPQCPDSGMPAYRAFTAEEKTKLAAFAATDDFKALKDEARYYRLAVVEAFMGEPANLVVGAYLSATWSAGSDANYARYGRVYVTAADAWLGSLAHTDDAWWYGNLQTANVERQMGDFAAASRRLGVLKAAKAVKPEGAGDWMALTERLITKKDDGEYQQGRASEPLNPFPFSQRIRGR